jgi:mono/diheme cytochrome c family protein
MVLFQMLLLSGLLSGSVEPAVGQDAKAVDRGKAVFAGKCSICHAIAGKGNPKGALDDVGTKLTADQIRQWLLTPKEMADKEKATRKPRCSRMLKLAKGDIDALVAFLQTLRSNRGSMYPARAPIWALATAAAVFVLVISARPFSAKGLNCQ